MDNKSIQVWLAVSPVVILLITQIFNYLDKRVAFRRPQQNNKLEDQYQKVLAPLHRLLCFGGDDISQKREAIEQVMIDYYFLVPQPIVESWSKEDYPQFKQHIDSSFQVAANRLGYTQIKLKASKQEQKQVEEALATTTRKWTKNDKNLVGYAVFLLIVSFATIVVSIVVEETELIVIGSIGSLLLIAGLIGAYREYILGKQK